HVERKRAIIAPYYEDIQTSDFECALMQATYHEKFNQITHRDVLGAFLSLGLDRKKLGDIIIHNGIIQIIIAHDLLPYVIANFTQVKRTSVTFEQKPITELIEI